MRDIPETGPTALPVLPFVANSELEAHFAALAQGRLLLPRCRRCGVVIWYPRAFCPNCGHSDVEWFESAGRGTIYSFTVVHRGNGVYANAVPYVLAYVELVEGARVLTNIVGPIEQVRIGLVVEAVVEHADDSVILRFRPTAAQL